MIHKYKYIIIAFLSFFFILIMYKHYLQANNIIQVMDFIPKNGFVPDEDTAVKIAEIIWIPIYGKKVLDNKPYKAELKGDTVWVVEGTLQKNMLGGVPYIEIRKSDCKILEVYHEK